MNNILNVLKQLSLNDKEVKIYLSLIQTGPSSVQNLSKATGISRATVYQRLESLMKQGLVHHEFGDKGKVVRAVHPDEIKKIIETRVEKSKKLASNFEEILPELSLMYKPTTTKAKIMYFEGIKGIQRMIYNYEMEAEGKNLYGYTTNEIEKLLGDDFINKYHRKFVKKGYRDHFIMSDNKVNRKYFSWVKKYKLFKEKGILVRKLSPRTFDPKCNIAIYDDVYSIALLKEGKLFGVLMQNQEIADHQMEIFKILWKQAKGI